MKHRVFLIATIFCLALGVFAAFAQEGVTTAEIELIPPAEPGDGMFFFSFPSGKTKWGASYKRSHDEVAFYFSGMLFPGIMVLTKPEAEAILTTGTLPEKEILRSWERMDREHCYILKDQTDKVFYVFTLTDASPAYAWLEIRHIRIPDGAEWKGNPGLAALLKASSKPERSGVRSVVVTGSKTPVLNLAEGKAKEVAAARKDLKEYYPAAAKAGDIDFFSQGPSPIRPRGTPFRKELLNAGCDYFDGVDAYPGKGDDLLLCLNKRCTVIPDDKLETLCKEPAKLVGDYFGVPMDITAAELPMVLLETSAKKLFLIVGRNEIDRAVIYYDIPRDGISKDLANEIRVFRSLLKKKNQADIRLREAIREREKTAAERKIAEEQAKQDALDKRVEAVKQQSVGDTFPKTEEEIKLVEDLIGRGQYEELLKLCEGKNLDFRVKGKRDPLVLVAVGMNPSFRDRTVLANKVNILEFMLENGCRSELSSDIGFSCASYAAICDNREAFFLLLKYGYDLNRKIKGKTVSDTLINSLSQGRMDPEIAKELRKADLTLSSRIMLNDLDGVKKALRDIKDPEELNKEDDRGFSLMHYVVRPEPESNSNPEILRALLDAGMVLKENMMFTIFLYKRNELLPVVWERRDSFSKDFWDKSFFSALSAKNVDAVRFFLENGFDLQTKDENGRTAVERVYRTGPKELVDIMDRRGFKKPFWAAVKWNDLDLAKEYLDAGTDANTIDPAWSDPPITIAVTQDNLEMAELLLEHGAYVSPEKYREMKKTYPIHVIVYQVDFSPYLGRPRPTDIGAKMAELLLKHGFVPDYPETPDDTKHPDESSALYWALVNKQYETAKVLLKYGARTDLTRNETVFDSATRKRVKKDVTLEERFSGDPEALKVLGAKKGFFDGF